MSKVQIVIVAAIACLLCAGTAEAGHRCQIVNRHCGGYNQGCGQSQCHQTWGRNQGCGQSQGYQTWGRNQGCGQSYQTWGRNQGCGQGYQSQTVIVEQKSAPPAPVYQSAPRSRCGINGCGQ